MPQKSSRADRSLASERAYVYLRDGIYGGQFAPGDSLTEDELATAIGVSRTPVREAIRRAAADGLIELEDFRRARVARFNEKDLDDLFDLRAALESLAAERAARVVTAAQIEELERMATTMETATVASEPDRLLHFFNDLNTQFHLAILKASGSREYIKAAQRLVETPLVLLRRYDGTLIGNLHRTNAHHRAIIAALKAGDAKWAQAEMAAHMLSARSNLL